METCCCRTRPWDCSDATVLTGYATMMMMITTMKLWPSSAHWTPGKSYPSYPKGMHPPSKHISALNKNLRFSSGQCVRSWNPKKHARMQLYPSSSHPPSLRVAIIFGPWSRVVDVIICAKFHLNRFKGCGTAGAENDYSHWHGPSPIQHYA